MCLGGAWPKIKLGTTGVMYLSSLSSYSQNRCSVDSTRRHLWLLPKSCVPGRKCSMFKHKMAVYTALLQEPWTSEGGWGVLTETEIHLNFM